MCVLHIYHLERGPHRSTALTLAPFQSARCFKLAGLDARARHRPGLARSADCRGLWGARQSGLLEQFLTHVWAPKLTTVITDSLDRKIAQVLPQARRPTCVETWPSPFC
jgi:hypothetical protein